MKKETKKFIGGVLLGFLLGSLVTFIIFAHFIVNTFGYVN